MTGALISDDDPKLMVVQEVTADLSPREDSASAENKPSVYAAYWQARSGFFTPDPKQAANQSRRSISSKN